MTFSIRRSKRALIRLSQVVLYEHGHQSCHRKLAPAHAHLWTGTSHAQGYLGSTTQSGEVVRAVVDFYREAKAKAVDTLVDSANQKPQYSLRTLARALEFVRVAWPVYGQARALYDGFAMAFHTQLHADCAPVLDALLQVRVNIRRTTLPRRVGRARNSPWD
jgi:hypothetical protein